MRHLVSHLGSLLGVLALSLSPSLAGAQSLGMAFQGEGNRVVVFDADLDLLLGTVDLPLGSICGDVVISPDLSLGFACNFNAEIYVIDLSTSPPGLAAGPNPIPISTNAEDLALTPDGAYLLATDGNQNLPISVVDVANRTEVFTLEAGFAPNSVDVSATGDVLVTSVGGLLRRYELQPDGSLTATGDSATTSDPNNVVIAPGGITAVVINRGGGGTLQSFSVAGLTPLDEVELSAPDPFGTSLAFSPDGTQVFARRFVGGIERFAYDPVTGDLAQEPDLTLPLGLIASCFGTEQVALHPSGRRLYTQNDGRLDVFDADTGNYLTTIADLPQGQGITVRTRAECFLVVGGGLGDDVFGAGGHVWSTQIEDIQSTYPVTLKDLPAFELPGLQAPGRKVRRARLPVIELAVQVVMWNPEVFPSNPEQFTQPLHVTLWSDGDVTARSMGERDHMHLRLETLEASGRRYARFPFSIDGFQ